jgi:hypothetical protein
MEPEEFQFLVSREGGAAPRTAANCVEARYSREDLRGRAVVRDEARNRYLVFESPRALAAAVAAQAPGAHSWHEVAFGWAPQRVRLDVDAGPARLAAAAAALGLTCEQAAEEAIAAILARTCEVLWARWEQPADERDLVVCESCGPTADGWKASWHVVAAPWAVANAAEARAFAADVAAGLPAVFADMLDTKAYGAVQCTRLVRSAKPGSRRAKRWDPRGAPEPADPVEAVLATLVAPPVHATALPRTAPAPAEPAAPAAPLPAAALEAALALVAAAPGGDAHRYRGGRATPGGALLFFNRLRPSACALCRRRHEHDNSLYLVVAPAAGGLAEVTEACRRGGRRRLLGTVPAPGWEAAPEAPEPEESSAVAAAIAEVLRGLGSPPEDAPPPYSSVVGASPPPQLERAQLNAPLPPQLERARAQPQLERLAAAENAEAYSEPAMRRLPLAPTLVVRAQMGVGKTKALRDWLADNFPAGGLDGAVVRVVTFRRTFGEAVARDLPGFVLYSAVDGDLDPVRHPRLIVQAESLHRLRPPEDGEPPAALVLDESESVLAQFGSGLHRHFEAGFAAFCWLVRESRHVICLDANLGARTLAALARLRPAAPPRLVWNRWPRARERGETVRVTTNQSAWLAGLLAAARAGRRLVVPTNSLDMARVVAESLRRICVDRGCVDRDSDTARPLRVALYSSETPAGERARDFANVAEAWAGLDALVYTPALTAGVSYEGAGFDEGWALFTDESCDVETCRQMMGRVRAVTQFTVCLRARGARLPETPADVRARLLDKRAALYRSAPVPFEYGPDGSPRFYDTDFFALWVENECVANASRNAFLRRFVAQVAETGAAVSEYAPGGGAAAADAGALARGVRAELAAAHSAAVAAAPDLDYEAAVAAREAARVGALEPARALALEKWRLREAFAWHGRPLGPEFALDYARPAVARVFANLRRVARGAPAALEEMRAAELARFAAAVDPPYALPAPARAASEQRALARERASHPYEALAVAAWLAELCGTPLAAPAARAPVPLALAEARLRGSAAALADAARRVQYQVRRRVPAADAAAPPAEFLRGALRVVNAALGDAFGLRVLASRDALLLCDGRVAALFGDAPGARPWIDWPDGPPAPPQETFFAYCAQFAVAAGADDETLAAAAAADESRWGTRRWLEELLFPAPDPAQVAAARVRLKLRGVEELMDLLDKE